MHISQHDVGSGICEDLVAKWACVYGYGVDACGFGSLYAEWGIFYHDGFAGGEGAVEAELASCLFESHQIGFGVGFAVRDVEGGHHDVLSEMMWVCLVEAL